MVVRNCLAMTETNWSPYETAALGKDKNDTASCFQSGFLHAQVFVEIAVLYYSL